LLAVDLSYQVYRASASHPMLTSRRTFTGGLYGFLTTLAKTIRETRADRIVICQDRKPYIRSQAYPEYKQLRKKREDDELLMMYSQSMKLVLDALEVLGFPVWGVDGFESDDLIGHVVHQHRSRFDRIYAGSNDSDLFQLLWCDRFFVYKDSIANLISGASLRKDKGLTPDQFMLATALQGTHNDIEGIPGVGEVRAAAAAKDPALLRKLQDKHGPLIARNLSLIKLPHSEFPWSTSVPQLEKSFSAQPFYRFCGRYDIDVTKAMLDSFEQLSRNQP
jgi:DNA polymerase-1